MLASTARGGLLLPVGKPAKKKQLHFRSIHVNNCVSLSQDVPPPTHLAFQEVAAWRASAGDKTAAETPEENVHLTGLIISVAENKSTTDLRRVACRPVAWSKAGWFVKFSSETTTGRWEMKWPLIYRKE